MRFVLAFLIAVVTGAVTATGAGAACPIERATYKAVEGTMQAEFQRVGKWPDWKSRVAFGVLSAPGQPRHWFLFDRGAARYIDLISTLDVRTPGWHPPGPDGGIRPLGAMHYAAMDAGLKVIPTFPDAGDPAPAYLFLPDIAEVLWSRAKPREDVRQSVLKFAGCRAGK